MSLLTHPDDLRTVLSESCDPTEYARLYDQLRTMMGAESQSGGAYTGSGLPFFEDIRPTHLTLGKSRRILQNQLVDLARVRYAEIEPSFSGVDPMVGEAMRGYWSARASGRTLSPASSAQSSGWTDEIDRAFLEGNALGVSFLQVGLLGTDQGTRRVHLRHVSPLQTVWDRHVSDPHAGRFVAFAHLLPVDLAAQRYGQAAMNHVRTLVGAGERAMKVVRVLEVFDKGIAGKDSTYTVLLDDFNGPVLQQSANPFGLLPMAAYVHFSLPGLRSPLGRVALQAPTQEAINEIESVLDTAIKQHPFTVIDTDLVDDSDLARLNSNDRPAYVRMRRPDVSDRRLPYYSVPGAAVHPQLFERMQMLQEQLNAESGVSDMARGNLMPERRTATEIEMLAQQSGATGTWPLRQLTRWMRRTVETVMHLAKGFDDDPVRVNVGNVDMILNDPADPRTWLSNLFDDQAEVQISEEAVLYADGIRKRSERLLQLDRLRPEVEAGLIAPERYLREKLRTLGFDPDDGWVSTPATP